MCRRYLLENMDWLDEELGGYEDDYLIFDCPGSLFTFRFRHNLLRGAGQIELYTHHPFLPTLVRHLQRLGLRTCAVYLIESQFMEDKYKFFRSVILAATRSQRTLTRRAPPFQWCALSDVRHGEP